MIFLQYLENINDNSDPEVWLSVFKWAQVALCAIMMIVGVRSILSIRWVGVTLASFAFLSMVGVLAAYPLLKQGNLTYIEIAAFSWLALAAFMFALGIALAIVDKDQRRLGVSITGFALLMSLAPLMLLRGEAILDLDGLSSFPIPMWFSWAAMEIGGLMFAVPGLLVLEDYLCDLAERRYVKVVGAPFTPVEMNGTCESR